MFSVVNFLCPPGGARLRKDATPRQAGGEEIFTTENLVLDKVKLWNMFFI